MPKHPKFSLSDKKNSPVRKHDSREDIFYDRIGENPVECVLKSILRKSNHSFNNNSVEDCSTSSVSIEGEHYRHHDHRYQKVTISHKSSIQSTSKGREDPSASPFSSSKGASGSKFPIKEDGEEEEGDKDYNNNSVSTQEQEPPRRRTEDKSLKLKADSSEATTSSHKKVSIQDSTKKSKSQPQRHKLLLLPEHIYSKIFSYLNQIELHTCTQVCRIWREYCDTFYNSPRTFNGRNSWNSTRRKHACRLFLTDQLLASENKRHFKLHFYNVKNWQMKLIVLEKTDEFLAGVKHMSKLHLVNCNLHWSTLITLLQSLPHLNTFTDTWSVHYLNTSCCSSMFRPNTRQGSLLKLQEKLALSELKNKPTRIRVFKLTRRSLRKELCVYFPVISRLIPLVEDFQFHVGPYRTPKEKLPAIKAWLSEFVKIFHTAMFRLRKNFKKITISWRDEGLDCLFDKCVDALHKLEFPKLSEITLRMSEVSMRSPQQLPQFVRFLNSFDWKPERNRFLHLKVFISPIFMTKEWMEMLYTFQNRIMLRKFHVSVRVGVKMDDKVDIPQRSATVTDIFGNYVFFRGLTKLQVHIHQEGIQSLREIIPGIRTTYPNVESLEVRIGDRKPGICYAFRDYSVMAIAFNFKFITELRISDQPVRKWDVLDCVWGTKDRASLTYAYISKRDMVLLCEMLTRLRVLMLWANLIDLRDINFTGIKSKFYYMQADGQYHLNKDQVSNEKREPSIQNLKHLRLLSLRGLGKDVTDITCRYAFREMAHLKYIELGGDTNITQSGRMRLHARMRPTGCKVSFFR